MCNESVFLVHSEHSVDFRATLISCLQLFCRRRRGRVGLTTVERSIVGGA